MNLQGILKTLSHNNVQYVIVGGIALNIHGSDRVTYDSDIVIKTIDIDRIIELLLTTGLEMVIGVDDNSYPQLTTDLRKARNFAEKSKWGFLKFISPGFEIDVLYEVSIPFIQLYNSAKIVRIGDSEIRVASLDHIRIMKEKALDWRDDEKRETDILDLKFIERKTRNSVANNSIDK